MSLKPLTRVPRATYRVQLHKDFNFEQLGQIIPYLHDLGISDVYTSPIFLASPGSTHGYDVCDHNEINPELGGMEGLLKISELLRQYDMGLIVDFVPNHMGIEGSANWRWMDVLENGPLSHYASFFDIHWHPRQTSLQERILVPILHDFYGRVLNAGEIKLKYADAAFWACYRTLRFPLRPESYGIILERLAWFKNPGAPVSEALERLANQFRSLPKATSVEGLENIRNRNRARDNLRDRLSQLIEMEDLSSDLDIVLDALNGSKDHASSFDTLHQILEDQNYRLAFWKAGTHEINYRRFFAVNSLVGLRMGNVEVFNETHRLLRDLIQRGIVTGVRVDHIDGLWDPAQYLQRLSSLGEQAPSQVYFLVEKILTPGEPLREDWATHGTTGYDFTGSLINLLADSRAEDEMTRFYQEFTGLNQSPQELSYDLKLFVMEELFSNEIDNLAQNLETALKGDNCWRDWALNNLRLAISRIIACLSVYRTYRREGEMPSATDINIVKKAVAATLRRNHSADPTPFRFISDLWSGIYPDASSSRELKTWTDEWICKLQQYTGAIMAKSIEDTLYYRYVRFFAGNEVGHDPMQFGRDVPAFHQDNLQRQQFWPASMLTTSTHDTKVSEDVRARLLALSEIPDRWESSVRRWSKSNFSSKTLVHDVMAPDANEEYLLYQILLGAWPLDSSEVDDDFCSRIKAYMLKALSEAKANTNWASPHEAWLNACHTFIEAILDRKRASLFWEDFVPFAEEIAVRGASVSLAQVALKLTSPGVPDIYQGNELWDFSLVDPDNRRPIDYTLRQERFSQIDQTSLEDLSASWMDGRIKMSLIHKLLDHRRKYPELFSQGTYQPAAILGSFTEHFVSFTRSHGNEHLLVVVQRHLGEGGILYPRKISETMLLSPQVIPPVWQSLLSPLQVTGTSKLSISSLLGHLPVGVFHGTVETLSPV